VGEAGRPVRIQASPAQRRLATGAQLVLLALIGLLGWSGGRLVALRWPDRGEPEVAHVLWLVVGGLAVAGLALAWLIVLIHDLVKLTVEVGPKAVTVDRLLGPFTAGWDEVREIGLVGSRGHLTLRSARGSLTVTERLLGRAAFAGLVAAFREWGGPRIRDWTVWQAHRRQLALLLLPALALGVLLAFALRRAPGHPGRGRVTR
ncbi:MAG: hypothetical protein ACREMB_07695, partial [Candidatus Rokuibacteriota bacterium]